MMVKKKQKEEKEEKGNQTGVQISEILAGHFAEESSLEKNCNHGNNGPCYLRILGFST